MPAAYATPWLPPERTANLLVRLGSGQEYTVQEILLFDQEWLTAAANYRAQAMNKLEGFQTGLGSIGSLGHVLTSSLIIGSVEGMVSSGMRKDGIRLLEHAEKLALQSRACCQWFAPAQIFSVELPIPEMWQAMQSATSGERRRYVHNGDPMVTVRLSDQRILSLIWDKVESYEQTPVSS